MPSLKVTIDGQVAMDGDLGNWSSEPPFITAQKLAVAAKRDEPWSVPLLFLMGKAAAGGPIKTITICTQRDAWTMTVTSA